jgi:hypothetical protein
MTQKEQSGLGALTQRFDDFIGMYKEDRKVFMETHDTVIGLKTESENTKRDVARNTEDIEELKSQPAKRWHSAVYALIGAAAGAIVGALSNLLG